MAIAAQTDPAKTTIGIQVGGVSFFDEGVEKVLDTFRSVRP